MKTLITIAALIATAAVSRAQPTANFGSSYNWFAQNPAGCYLPYAGSVLPPAQVSVLCFDPYYAIVNYDLEYPTINGQLRQMYNQGQRFLKLEIYHTRGTDLVGQDFFGTHLTGADHCNNPIHGSRHWIMDSTGGALPSQCAQNLKDMMAFIAGIGFTEIEIEMGPEGNNWFYGQFNTTTPPATWPTSWIGVAPYEGYYLENMAIIAQVRSLAIATGVNYKFSILFECINIGVGPSVSYCQRSWNDYFSAYGKSDTVGHSFAGVGGWAGALSTVYGGNKPNWLDLHLYPTQTSGQPDPSFAGAFNIFSAAAASLLTQGFNGIPITIGETWFNVPDIQLGFQSASQATSNTIRWYAAWPSDINYLYHSPPLYGDNSGQSSRTGSPRAHFGVANRP